MMMLARIATVGEADRIAPFGVAPVRAVYAESTRALTRFTVESQQ